MVVMKCALNTVDTYIHNNGVLDIWKWGTWLRVICSYPYPPYCTNQLTLVSYSEKMFVSHSSNASIWICIGVIFVHCIRVAFERKFMRNSISRGETLIWTPCKKKRFEWGYHILLLGEGRLWRRGCSLGGVFLAGPFIITYVQYIHTWRAWLRQKPMLTSYLWRRLSETNVRIEQLMCWNS